LPPAEEALILGGNALRLLRTAKIGRSAGGLKRPEQPGREVPSRNGARPWTPPPFTHPVEQEL
jgi:hypothetical protein